MIGRTLPTPTFVVLAAGYSERLGQPKALATVRGRSLLSRTLAVLVPFAAPAKIMVIIPPRCHRYRIGRHAASAIFLVNARPERGLSSSVKRGINRARHSAAILLLPVDLVRLDARDVGRLIACWRGRRRAVVARRRGKSAATPLILPHALYARALGITGDQGLRDWVRQLPEARISLVDMPSAEADVDTPVDLELARRSLHTRITA